MVDPATHMWHPFPNVPKHQFKPLKFRTTLPQEIRQNEEFQLMDCIENRAEYNSTANVDRSNTPQGLIKQAVFFFLMGGQVHTSSPNQIFLNVQQCHETNWVLCRMPWHPIPIPYHTRCLQRWHRSKLALKEGSRSVRDRGRNVSWQRHSNIIFLSTAT